MARNKNRRDKQNAHYRVNEEEEEEEELNEVT
jgi:hypothetical protein